MYRFFQKHGKKLMAVFSAFLMIAFALPAASRFTGSGQNPVIGTLGEEKLRLREYISAKHSWDVLKTIPGQNNRSLADEFGPMTVAQINQNPVMYLLLQKEAQSMGVAVSNDQMQSLITNAPQLFRGDEARQDNVKLALRDFLLVRLAFGRAANAIKVSQPILDREQAEFLQSITLGAVEFNTAKYTDKVPAPTAEQLKAQFEKYADVAKGGVSESNLFGFGYRYPNRVKLQYIVLPKDEVRKQVEASKDAYAWRVEAQKFYIQNPAQFVSTTQPESKPEDALSLGSGGVKKGPTTKPFGEVEEKIRKDLIDAQTNKRLAQITDRLNTTLASDWVSYHAVTPDEPVSSSATAPTSAPTTQRVPLSSLRVAYNSFDYLQKLADAIQKEFAIRPTVVQLADKWLTAEELEKVPGLGQAHADGRSVTDDLLGRLSAFLTKEQQKEADVLHVMEPTKPLRDAIDNVYVARVTEAEASHKPASIAEVEATVKADVITAAAFAMAKADAGKLLDAARKEGLKAAAGATPVTTVGPISQRGGQVVQTLALTGSSATEFIVEAFKLLTTATSRPNGEPVRLVELPRDGRVFVTELGKVEALWTTRSLPYEQSQLRAMVMNQWQAGFARNWFDFTSVKSRLKYVPDASFQEGETHIPPSLPPPPPPIF